MPLYSYKANNSRGVRFTGYRYAASKDAIFTSLKAEGLLLTHCEENTVENFSPAVIKNRVQRKTPRFSRSVPILVLIDFCHNMAQLDEAGVPLTTALNDLALSTPHRKFHIVLLEIVNNLQSGLPLSKAFANHPDAFDQVFQVLIGTAEHTGAYAPQFRHLESHLRRKDQMKHQLQKSLRTPAILFCLLVGLMGIIVELVIPNMATLLISLGLKELPLSTRLLLYMATVLSWTPLIFGSIASILGAGYFIPDFRYKISQYVLYIPFYKSIILNHFWHVFAVMIEAGIDLIPSLTQASQIVPNPYMRDRFAVLINRIRDGVGLSEAFKVSEKGSTLVSPLIIRFLKLSEQTGNMRKLIPQAAAQHHNQLYRQVETCIAWLEPALILVMGGFMLWIVLAVMVPFYSLLEDVNV